MNYIELNNGVKMPVLGLGTYLLEPRDAENAVCTALKNGYQLIDTANAYQNEIAVGKGIKKSGIARDKVFLETKLWPCFYEDEGAVDRTLTRLGVDYIDLMILHQPAGNFKAGYEQLEKAYKAGKLKAIGISNFNIEEISRILAHCEVKPALIQVECHPYFPQDELKAFLKKENIALQAWYPLGGRGNDSIMNEKVIKEIAAGHGKTAAQVIMRWHIQMNNIVIPGSKTESHILDNISVFDFELSAAEMNQIAALNKHDTIYHRTDAQLAQFAKWVPNVEND